MAASAKGRPFTRPSGTKRRGYAAGRQKDLHFTRELARHGMTNEAMLIARLAATDVAKPLRTLMAGRIKADSAVRERKS